MSDARSRRAHPQPFRPSVGPAEVHVEEGDHIQRARARLRASGGRTFEDTSALCLSGGGIRSASFAMGFLQGLAERKLVSAFDYVSAVSGGGYALGWWVGLARRVTIPPKHVEPEDIVIEKVRAAEQRIASNRHHGLGSDGELQDPFERRYVRAHGNYLTIRTGLLSADTWAAVFTMFRNLVFGLAGLGFLFVAIAWQFLAMLDILAGFGGRSRQWLAVLAAALIALAWSRICSALYRDTSGLENNLNGKTTLWLLASGLAAMTLFLVIPTMQHQPVGSSDASNQFAIGTVILLAVVDLCVWIVLLVHRKLTLRQKLSWLFSSTISAIAAVTIVAAAVSLVATTRAHVEGLFNSRPEQAYLLWLLFIMTHAWELTRARGMLFQGWVNSGSGQFRFDRAVVGDLITVVLCVCLLFALPLTVKLIPNSLQPGWLWIMVGLVAMSLGGFAVIFNALVMVSQGGQANTIQREWWSRWGSEFMLATSALSAAFAAGGAALLVIPQAARTWLWYSIAGVLALVIAGMVHAKNQLYVLILRFLGMSAVVLTIVASLLAARAIDSLGNLDLPHLPLTLSWPVALLTVISLLVLLRSGPNTFSMHELYRNRLVRAFLGASNPERNLVRAVDFATNDDMELGDLVEQGCASTPSVVMRPFPIWCATVNVTTSHRIGLQERKAASFTFSPLYCGLHVDALEQLRASTPAGPRADKAFAPVVEYASDYCCTSGEYEQEPLTVGTVVATSGAAFSSNTGATTKPERALLLTLLGFRLGRWFPNPATCIFPSMKSSEAPANPWTAGLPLYISRRPWAVRERLRAWVSPLILREALSKCDVDADAVYLTDGGHFENLGIYEMIRRRARLIVSVDAACDPKFAFEDLLNLQSKVRSDFGVEICLGALDQLSMGPKGEVARASFLEWQVVYRRDDRGQPCEVGRLIYCKSTLTGEEPSDLLAYRKRVPSFPHISTVNQWFAESAFEAYRSLGLHIGRQVAGKLESYVQGSRT